MRILVILMLSGTLAVLGCDSSSGGSAGSGGSGGSGGSAGSGGSGGSGGSAGSAGEGGGGDGGAGGGGGTTGGEAPVITMVAWAPDGSCAMGVASNYTVTVTATDADSDLMDLIYNGSVTGCTGGIDDATSTISCPNVRPYGGSVLVTDDDGNESAPVNFTIGVCETSSTP